MARLLCMALVMALALSFVVGRKAEIDCGGQTSVPHPNNCRKYYDCQTGQAQLKTCGKGECFDPDTDQCKAKEPVDSQSTPPKPMIGFSAKADVHQVGIKLNDKINFKTVITNIGGAYNGDTSVFTCPVKGVYHFEVTILSKLRQIIHTELMAGGVSRMLIYSGADPSYGAHGSGSNSVLLELNAGDVVYVRQTRGEEVHRLFSTFTGIFIG